MKIENKENVQVLRLRHNGVDFTYMQHLKTVPNYDLISIKPAYVGCIEFDDLREVDSLIDILQNFKEEIERGAIGEWKRGI